MEHSASLATHGVRTQLPVSRVKKIFRLESNCATISAEAVQLLTFATECFISLLAKVAYGQAVFDKRKTLQLRDLGKFCIENYEPFNFLDGTLDGWPEVKGGKHGLGSSVNMPTKRSEGLVSPDADDEQKDLNGDGISLGDEIFGFDVLFDGNEPFDAENAEKNNALTSKNAGTISDFVREAQSI
ncbi:unnamed protein product [Litomosoides sigmodontis]|uniref:Transcription factor CBF/NF-Y/archaeal histone domain-containing protein n=1 Tax=Litomosoides sigmodontis TaxID=42156 RepID=A0A3P6TX90_LITSI|nr:unnamed protein product [Litomosoides sigmodontis]